MRRVVLSALAALGVSAGLVVTASSTSDQAYEAGMRGLALGALVVVLEVTNVLGTWVTLTDSRRHAQIEAGLFVAAGTVVTAWFGCLSYGPKGLVGPLFVLGGVELARLASSTPTGAKPAAKATGSDAESPSTPDPATATVVPAAVDKPSTAGDDVVDEVRDATLSAAAEVYTTSPVLPASSAVRDTADTGPTTEPFEPPKRLERVPERPAKPAPKRPRTSAEEEAAEAARAAELIAEAAEKPSETQLLKALRAEGYSPSRYRIKKYLGYRTRPLEAVG